MSYSRANDAAQPSDSDGGSSYQKASTQDSSPQNSASQSLHRNGNGNGSSNGSMRELPDYMVYMLMKLARFDLVRV